MRQARSRAARDVARVFGGALYKHVIVPFRDFIYPPVCLACDALVEDDGARVCRRCWNSIPGARAGDPAWTELQRRLAAEGAVSNFHACFLFEQGGVLQKILHELKYGGMRSLAEPLGREAGRQLHAKPDFLSADYLVPVPLNKIKRRERGYNQAEEICRWISAETHLPVSSTLLKRQRYTESQTGLDRDERMKNMRGAFALRRDASSEVHGRTIILVDDVITTGSTVSACAAELLHHGADKVLASAAAIAP